MVKVKFNVVKNNMDLNLSKIWKIVEDRESWHAIVHGVAKNWTQLNDQPTTATTKLSIRQLSIIKRKKINL